MITLADLLAAGARLHGLPHTTSFTDLSYDSRLTQPGELFLALRTPHADGHDYIAAALAAGATGVICAWPPHGCDKTTIIIADDPLALIQRWATQRLATVAPQVIAVTGSVGKTSAVRAIAALLGQRGACFRSRQSFNSLLGLPIALARLHNDDRFAVLEFGADQFGEIARLAALFPPEIAVVTSVAAAHLDTFGTLAGVAREKAALVAALPAHGWALLNGDDSHVAAMRAQTHAQILTFGMGAHCDLRASVVKFEADHTTFRLDWAGESIAASIPLLGAPAITTALAAVGTALACGLTLTQAAAGLALVEPVAWAAAAAANPNRRGPCLMIASTLRCLRCWRRSKPSARCRAAPHCGAWRAGPVRRTRERRLSGDRHGGGAGVRPADLPGRLGHRRCAGRAARAPRA